jgi:hypothetical protein
MSLAEKLNNQHAFARRKGVKKNSFTVLEERSPVCYFPSSW